MLKSILKSFNIFFSVLGSIESLSSAECLDVAIGKCLKVLVINRINGAQILNVLSQFLLASHFLPTLETLEETFATNLFTFSHALVFLSSGCLSIYPFIVRDPISRGLLWMPFY